MTSEDEAWDIFRGPWTNSRAGGGKVNSQVFDSAMGSEWLDIVERSAPTEAKEETAHSLRASEIEAPTTLGTFACSPWKRRMMVVHLDWLAPDQGTAQDKREGKA
jgi:hypothetical protein